MPIFRTLPADDPALDRREDFAEAVAQLGAAELTDAPAQAHRRSVLDFVVANPQAASRTNPGGHLTGSALVVDPASGRTLLMLHAKLGRWFQPGGHADGETNLAAVALREATEETGIEGLSVVVPAIDVDVHRVEPPGEEPHLHLDTRFLVLAPAGSVERGNEESLALRWVGPDDLDEMDPPIDESTRRLVQRGLAVVADLVG